MIDCHYHHYYRSYSKVCQSFIWKSQQTNSCFTHIVARFLHNQKPLVVDVRIVSNGKHLCEKKVRVGNFKAVSVYAQLTVCAFQREYYSLLRNKNIDNTWPATSYQSIAVFWQPPHHRSALDSSIRCFCDVGYIFKAYFVWSTFQMILGGVD